MSARTYLPAAGVHLRTPIAEGFRVARGNERCERTPNSGLSKERTVFEIAGLADAMEDETNIVAAMAPDFVQPA